VRVNRSSYGCDRVRVGSLVGLGALSAHRRLGRDDEAVDAKVGTELSHHMHHHVHVASDHECQQSVQCRDFVRSGLRVSAVHRVGDAS